MTSDRARHRAGEGAAAEEKEVVEGRTLLRQLFVNRWPGLVELVKAMQEEDGEADDMSFTTLAEFVAHMYGSAKRQRDPVRGCFLPTAAWTASISVLRRIHSL